LRTLDNLANPNLSLKVTTVSRAIESVRAHQ
jgi:hypothetical protein